MCGREISHWWTNCNYRCTTNDYYYFLNHYTGHRKRKIYIILCYSIWNIILFYNSVFSSLLNNSRAIISYFTQITIAICFCNRYKIISYIYIYRYICFGIRKIMIREYINRVWLKKKKKKNYEFVTYLDCINIYYSKNLNYKIFII